MKKCFKCGVEKSLSEFYRHVEMADGHLNKCKECGKKDVRTNYSLNKKYYHKYEQIRNQDYWIWWNKRELWKIN